MIRLETLLERDSKKRRFYEQLNMDKYYVYKDKLIDIKYKDKIDKISKSWADPS